jgi:hypothetical protein
MNCFYPNNAEYAKLNHAMILSDDVSDNDSIYYRTGSDEYHWQKVEQSVQKMLHQMIIAVMK